ncbi:MAG: hypothetical protein NTY12_02280 [Candidatus Falkowbacteria bacterium]|nr:hypothetical protein [Candidatus Falkowbacteria bacterium]
MKYSKYISLFIVTLGLATLSGCTLDLGFGNKAKGPDGAVFKTTTKGETWQQKALIPTTSGTPIVINSLDTSVLALDPSDQNAIYYGTVDNGLLYSYNGADSWFPVSTLGKFTIKALAVDPQNKCAIYAAIENKVMKSVDCSRTWQQIYYDNDLTVSVANIAIDHYDSKIVYIATSRGEIIASSDSGKSWRTLNRFEDKVKKVIISPADSRVILVAAERKGLFRSDDKGITWKSLSESLKDFPDSGRFRDLYVSKAQPGLVIFATNYGLLKSINYGDDWTAIKLITPEKEAVINSVIVSEQNTKEIFYVTNTTFYGTADGGENWTTKKLPSTRAGWMLMADPKNINTMYLGVQQLNN